MAYDAKTERLISLKKLAGKAKEKTQRSQLRIRRRQRNMRA